MIPAFIGPLEDLMEAIILFFHDNAGLSWGLAIVALTFVVRLALLPLSLRSIRSMRRLQVLAPQLKEIQERYKDDQQRQQREMVQFYRDNKINPLASCIPLLLQIPFFFAIYNLLRGADFKADVEGAGGAGFLFIDSIVEKPQGTETLALIALFIATTIPTFLLTMSTNPNASRGQRALFAVLPVIFAPFIATLPSGLAVYWIATNIWSLGQQAVVQRIMPAPTPPAPGEAAPAAAAVRPPPPPPRKKKKRRR